MLIVLSSIPLIKIFYHSKIKSTEEQIESRHMSTTESSLPDYLQRSPSQETKPLPTGLGGPNTVIACSSPLMLPLTTSLCGNPTLSGSGHYNVSNALFAQYPSLFPPNLLPPTSSSEDANGSSSQRSLHAPPSSYPMIYQPLGLSLPPYYTQSPDLSNGFLGSSGKHQGLLPGIGNFPPPSLGFPSHPTPSYNSQSMSPFMQYPTNRGSMNDNSSAANNSNIYSNFTFSKQPFLGGTTQIYPPAPQAPTVMHQMNPGDQLGGQSCPPMNLPNNGRRESASSPSQPDNALSTTPVSAMEGLSGKYHK